MGNIIDVRRFGGLRRIMPITHWTFLIGCLALSGVFPFAGFWSKDAILGAVEERAHELAGAHETAHQLELQTGVVEQQAPWMLWSPELAGNIYLALYYVGLFTALLTAFYTFRVFFLTFYGDLRVPPEAGEHAHESPPTMAIPLIILAVCPAVAGFSQAWIGDFIGFTPQLATGIIAATRGEMEFHFQVAALSTLMAASGIALAAFLYLESRHEADWLASFMTFQWYHRLFDADRYARMRRWGWVQAVEKTADRAHLGWLARLLGRVAQLALWILSAPLLLFSMVTPYRLSANKFYFDELYDFLIVRPLRMCAALFYTFDRVIIDGSVNAIGKIPLAVGNLMRSLQMGLVPFYALCMAMGMLLLVVVRVLWGS